MLASTTFAGLFPNFARASTATAPDDAGVLQSYASGAPRVVGGSGVLIEGAATNIIANSQTGLSGSPAGGNTNAVSTEVSPLLAGQTVRKHLRATDTATYTDDQSGLVAPQLASLTPSTLYAWSAYVWVPSGVAFGAPYLRTEGGGMTGGTTGLLDLSKRDQWQRVAGTGTTPASITTSPSLVVRLSTGAGQHVYITCPQYEAGGLATSYFPTSGSVAARVADTLLLDGARFSSALGAGARGWVVVEALLDANTSGVVRVLACVDDGTSANRLTLRPNSTGGSTIVIPHVASAQGTAASTGPPPFGSAFRAAMRWAPGAYAVCLNGGSVVSVSAVIPASFTTLRIGSTAGNVEAMNGRVRSAWCGHTAPSDAQLIAATALGADVRSIMRS